MSAGRIRTNREQAVLRRVQKALRLMRGGRSLTAASQRASTTAATVQRYAPHALDRMASGQYVAHASDRLARRIRVLTSKGLVVIEVRGFRTASMLARHANAVDHYLRSGDVGPLRAFRDRAVQSRGQRYPLIIDPQLLDRLAAAGEVHFEDLYDTVA